jgi:para-nitrobenzyl esterase
VALTLRAGSIEGLEANDRRLRVYKGIPYGRPPIRELRWRPPQPAPAWSGVRRCTAFGPAAPQTADPTTPVLLPGLAVDRIDEDCLTANVWSPAHAGPARPVLVWLHGGAFVTGSSGAPSYDGAALATDGDVVVVSVNYRLGALGFVPVAGHHNLGLLDQILALAWVRDNIEAFGGDPERVTVFGESAGGGSVLHLLASPPARGLFRRAISQSGATDLTLTADQAEMVADRFRIALAPDDPATAPVGRILQAQRAVLADMASTIGLMPYHPSLDGEVVTHLPTEAPPVGGELIVGTTADEMRLFLDARIAQLDDDGLARRAARYLKPRGITDPAPILAAYAARGGTVAERWAAIRTGAEMWLPALAVAENRVGQQQPTFAYRFDWPAAGVNAALGACHGVDLPFTFGAFEHTGWGEFVGVNGAARALSAGLRAAWCAFAATGDPTTEALGYWPEYGVAARTTMVLGAISHLAHDPDGAIRGVWQHALAHRLRSSGAR